MENMKSLDILKVSTLLLTLLFFHGCEKNGSVKSSEIPDFKGGTWTSPNGAGELIIEDSIRILKLSGTNNEMGYAHGYLLAKEIIYLFDKLLDYLITESGYNYNELQDLMNDISWENNYMDELEGMLSGIHDRLPADERMIHVAGEERELNITDLKIFNAMSEWGCSSFSVWGDARSDGSVLFARNFDYYIGPDNELKNVQVIISYNDGINNSWVTASVCGFIGCITGMNAYGMALAIHDNNYYESSDNDGYIPRCLMLRRLAENAGAGWTPANIETILDTTKALTGMNLHVAFPASGRTDDETAGIIEFDGNALHADGRATLRLPANNNALYQDELFNLNLDYTHGIICTNHFLLRKISSEGSWDSAERILVIKNRLETAADDGNVSIGEALDIMDKVGDDYTVHTAIFEPGKKRLHFYLSKPKFGGFEVPVRTFDYEDLF